MNKARIFDKALYFLLRICYNLLIRYYICPYKDNMYIFFENSYLFILYKETS